MVRARLDAFDSEKRTYIIMRSIWSTTMQRPLSGIGVSTGTIPNVIALFWPSLNFLHYPLIGRFGICDRFSRNEALCATTNIKHYSVSQYGDINSISECTEYAESRSMVSPTMDDIRPDGEKG